eukprot:SM000332S12442  [mRNA]  locus=s332:79571:81666:+ [translate_table: standard]
MAPMDRPPSSSASAADQFPGRGVTWHQEEARVGSSVAKASGDAQSSGSDGGGGEDDDANLELEEGYKMTRVCDRLIEVFSIERPEPAEWRKLLAFSEEWSSIRPHFFRRCRTRAEQEADAGRKADLFRLARRLKDVDDDMQRHSELLAAIEADPNELSMLVARRRKDFTGDFFEHLQTLCQANYRDPKRRDELAALAAQCLAAVEGHDASMEDAEALEAAQLKFDDILLAPSLEAACHKIDELASRRQLDSTLMLLITKAWAAAKESTMMKDEVKDIMYHLYMTARGNLSRLVPKEVRILRHILSLEDPRERLAAMGEAFSPGPELEGQEKDLLYTTPKELHKWAALILDAYRTSKAGSLIKEAQKLMNPAVIHRLQHLKEVLEDEYM